MLPPNKQQADYDNIAAIYDLVVGNSLYNRLVWGNWASDYAQAATDAVALAGDGQILDCGCGSLIFTASAYRSAPVDRMIFFDRSIAMMERAARRRLDGARYLQADALDLPFRDDSFANLMAWGLLHIFGSRSPLLPELARVAGPGGRLSVSTLVSSGRFPGDAMLRVLHKKGEVARPETASEIEMAFAQFFTIEKRVLKGNMLCLTGRRTIA